MNSFIEHSREFNQSIIKQLFESLPFEDQRSPRLNILVLEVLVYGRAPKCRIKDTRGITFGGARNVRKVTDLVPEPNPTYSNSRQPTSLEPEASKDVHRKLENVEHKASLRALTSLERSTHREDCEEKEVVRPIEDLKRMVHEELKRQRDKLSTNYEKLFT